MYKNKPLHHALYGYIYVKVRATKQMATLLRDWSLRACLIVSALLLVGCIVASQSGRGKPRAFIFGCVKYWNRI